MVFRIAYIIIRFNTFTLPRSGEPVKTYISGKSLLATKQTTKPTNKRKWNLSRK